MGLKKGHTSWNKNRKMQTNTGRTHFKKGFIPWNKNKPFPKMIGNTNAKGCIPWNKGSKGKYKMSFKDPVGRGKKISEAQKGEKGSNWKGGITPKNKRIRSSIEFDLWRISVFARDNWICQKTGIKGGKLHPHHILNFSSYIELRFAIDNGITLSEKAHKEFHKKYGRKNNTKEQLIEFLENNAI